MSINVANLELTILNKIDNTTSELELLTYQKALEQLRTGSVSNSSTFASLPLATENRGKLYFVESEELVYFSNGSAWVSILNTQLGQIYEFGAKTGVGFSYVTSPVREFTSDINWAFIHADGQERRYLKQNGTLWSVGHNCCGAMGIGCAEINGAYSSPVQEITKSTDWCVVSSGFNFPSAYVHAIKKDGTMWSWGLNYNGSLGRYSGAGVGCPSQIIDTSCDWLDVKSNFGVLALKKNNTLWVWGPNGNGNLGTNNTVCYSSPVQEITSSSNWVTISTSSFASSGIKSDGTLWTWGGAGYGSCGILGDNTDIGKSSPVREISSSTNWCCVSVGISATAIKTNGTLWNWGRNHVGQLGINNTANRSSPVQEITSSTNWAKVCNGNSVTAIKSDGTLWGWGHNGTCLSTYCGNLGDGSNVDRSSPVQEFTSSTSWDVVANGTGTLALDLTNL